jgi:periodic tryptophan protein 1
VFALGWSPDDPLTLVAGGSMSQVQIWDVGQNAGVRQAFKTKLAQAGRELKEKQSDVVGVINDEESDKSGDDA